MANMAGYGAVFPILGLGGAAVWLAVDTIERLRAGRYESTPWDVVSRQFRPKLFRAITLLRWLMVTASGGAALWFIWLTCVYSN